MKHILGTTALTLLIASTASAGGIERNRLNDMILFEDGNYTEFGFTFQQPEISGAYSTDLQQYGSANTGNMANSGTYFSLGYKQDLAPGLSVALITGQPYAASAEYTDGAYTGLAADWSSSEARMLAGYEFQQGITAFGGVRVVQSEASIAIPGLLALGASGADPATGIIGQIDPAVGVAPANYRNDEADAETDFGFVLGMAYERPDIALRVALTYESSVTHEFSTTERYTKIAFDPDTGAPIGDEAVVAETLTEVDLPQAVTLDFQTGVAQNTLLFGALRWVEWTAFEVRSPAYDSHTGDAFVSYDNDSITYELGLGYRVSDQFALFGQVGFEEAKGGDASRLAPTDGYTAITVGGSYTVDTITIGGGVNYTMLGEATDASGVEFADNNVLGFGMNVGYNF